MERRCSYMLGSLSFEGLPKELKEIVFAKIKNLMTTPRSKLPPEYSYFEENERKEIDEALGNAFRGYPETK